MLSQEERNDLHQRVLENAYVFLNAAGAVNKEMNLGRDADIRMATNKAEQILQRTYTGDDLSYADYADVSEMARDISRQLWNPRGETVAQKVAMYMPNENAIGWRADNDPNAEALEIPHRMTIHLERELAHFDSLKMDELSPYQQKVKMVSGKSARAGVNAYDNLANLALAGKELLGETSERRLPRLSVEFVSEPALRVFLRSSATLGALPDDAESLGAMVDAAGKKGRIDNETLEAAVQSWSQERPAITRDWIRHACEAMATTASSTKLDSLASSSMDKVKEIIEQVYSERHESGVGNRFKVDKDKIRQDRNLLLNALENIEESLGTLTDNTSGQKLPMALIQRIGQEVDNLRDLVRAAEVSQYDDQDEESMDYPSMS